MNLVSTARADVQERERIDRRIQPRGSPVAYLSACNSTLDRVVSDRLRFEHSDGLPVDEQHVVGEPVTRRHLELATATPRPAARFISSRFWTIQPASARAASISWRARSSGLRGMATVEPVYQVVPGPSAPGRGRQA